MEELDLFDPATGVQNVGVPELLDGLERQHAAGLVDGYFIAFIVEVETTGLVGEHAEPLVVDALGDRAHLDVAVIPCVHLCAGFDEVVPGLDRICFDAGFFIKIPAVEDGGGTRVVRYRVDNIAHHEFGPLELGKERQELFATEGAQVGKAVGELGPEHFGLVVFDQVDVG